MAYCTFDEGAAIFDATPVDNMFITEYMLRAPGDYVKVYLYALMLCAHPSERMSNASMARDLDMTEEDVVRAFKYWARCGLARQTGDNPPAYALRSAKQVAMSRVQSPAEQLYHREFTEEVRRILGDRILTTSDYQTIFDWTDVLELPEEVVLMLLQTEMKQSGGRVSIQIANRHAEEWAKSGIRTVEDVEKIVLLGKEREQQLRRLLARLGQHRAPSEDEKEMYRKWLDDWGFAPDAVLEACRETTKGTPTMAYLDGILKRQHASGRHAAGDLEAGMAKEKQERDFARQVLSTLGRTGITPTQEDLGMIEGWRAQGMSDELILLAAKTAHRRSSGGSLEETGDVLARWRGKGLLTAEAVRGETERVRQMNAALREIYDAAGLDKRPGAADRSLLSGWQQAGHSRELILLAAAYAKNHPSPMAAADRILSDWQRAGITDVKGAQREHEAHRGAVTSRGNSQAERRGDYLQRSYTEADFRAMEVNLDEEDEGHAEP